MKQTKAPDENTRWIVDDVQRVFRLDGGNFTTKEDGGIEIHSPLSHKGQKYAPEFVYPTEEAADVEVHNRHRALNQAFEKMDLLTCLSINKEAIRKSKGFSQKDLDQAKADDHQEYGAWKENLKVRYKEINRQEPDMVQLVLTLRNAALIKEALDCPLGHEFTRVLSYEVTPRKARILSQDRYPKPPEPPKTPN